MPTFNVHLYREMRLYFPDIEADTPEQAAKIVAEKATDEAETIADCEGISTAALVDRFGDEDFSGSVTVDLDPMQGAAPELYTALHAIMEKYRHLIKDWEKYESGESDFSLLDEADAILAKARGEALPEAVLP